MKKLWRWLCDVCGALAYVRHPSDVVMDTLLYADRVYRKTAPRTPIDARACALRELDVCTFTEDQRLDILNAIEAYYLASKHNESLR
jgi:hypothetical protein